AINATNGKIIWKSPKLAPEGIGYHVVNPPIVWNNYVIAGSAGGDLPTEEGKVTGNVTALNRTNGEILWNFKTTVGDWVKKGKTPPNGGATTWSGGSFDPQKGILYIPAGNPTPDFDISTRPLPNEYSNNMLAINITNGKLLWHTPFVAAGTVLDVPLPNATAYDWDTAWGSHLVTISSDNDSNMKVVIGHNKRGDIIAMDAATGEPIWTKNVAVTYHNNVLPGLPPNGSGPVWPGTQYGIEDYSATSLDNKSLYVAVSNMGFNFFLTNKTSHEGYLSPMIDQIKNGVGNGSIISIDIATGKTNWEHPTEFPTWVSPVVSNGLVFSGHITDIGKPYTVNVFGAPISTPLSPSGIILALDETTGDKLWEFNVGAPIGIGGPSIGDGMLLVPTSVTAEIHTHKAGTVFAFGLPE
ncbi:MAG TPA: PQQ-binding-like beta-propeller repeat protein, partial [Nitrososphaeraceae archaeon]|nr:PQQ-binding-like beta-propeller repeat protein [Nitrososphaeraceae archaeon]